MKIPKKIKVGGHIYDVDTNYFFKERFDRCGSSDHQQKEIKITKIDTGGRPRHISDVEVTFIHELLHCVDEVYNANSLEEKSVSVLAEGLYQVLKDNKLLK